MSAFLRCLRCLHRLRCLRCVCVCVEKHFGTSCVPTSTRMSLPRFVKSASHLNNYNTSSWKLIHPPATREVPRTWTESAGSWSGASRGWAAPRLPLHLSPREGGLIAGLPGQRSSQLAAFARRTDSGPALQNPENLLGVQSSDLQKFEFQSLENPHSFGIVELRLFISEKFPPKTDA